MATTDRTWLAPIEAANYLNVSRPFVIKEVESGKLAHLMVGGQLRIELEGLKVYKAAMRLKQGEALQRMADDAHELGLEY